jgi:hypothetical protein
VASKLFFVGLVDVFRSGLFILPILTLLAEIALIIQKVNDKSGYSPQNILQLIKSSLLLIVVAVAVRAIGMLPGLGYSASLLGVLIFIISSVDPFLKLACPYVAPHMAQLSSFIGKMETVENQLIGAFVDRTNKISHGTPIANAVLVSERVEVIPDDADDVSEEKIGNSNQSDASSGSPIISTGIRKRKVA